MRYLERGWRLSTSDAKQALPSSRWHGWQNVECGMWNVECTMQDAEAGCKQNAEDAEPKPRKHQWDLDDDSAASIAKGNRFLGTLCVLPGRLVLRTIIQGSHLLWRYGVGTYTLFTSNLFPTWESLLSSRVVGFAHHHIPRGFNTNTWLSEHPYDVSNS